MRASTYAQALRESLDSAQKTEESGIVERFVAVVRRNGHTHLLPAIVRSLERITAKRRREVTLELITAVPLSSEERDAILATHSAPKDRTIVTRVDPTIVGGYILRSRSQRIDASHKHTLFTLYQRIVN